MVPVGPPEHGGGDARRSPRLAVDLEATLGGRHPREARVADLSLAGCLLRTDAALDPGAVVDLTLGLPDGPLRTKARVAEASIDGDAAPGPGTRYLAGFAFLALGAADERRLRGFLDGEARRRRGAVPRPA
jgi:hypothetical protein